MEKTVSIDDVVGAISDWLKQCAAVDGLPDEREQLAKYIDASPLLTVAAIDAAANNNQQ